MSKNGDLGYEHYVALAHMWAETFDSPHTRRTYKEAVRAYLGWCFLIRHVDPALVIFLDASAYNVHMRDAPTVLDRRTGTLKPMAPSSRKARLGALSTWSGFLMRLGIAKGNPFDPRVLKRPSVEQDDSPTIGLTAEEGAAMIEAGRNDTGPQRLRTAALIGFLLTGAPRVSEATQALTTALGTDRGHRRIRVLGKGDKPRPIPLPPDVAYDHDVYLDDRAAAAGCTVAELNGILYCTSSGGPMQQSQVWELVQRIARLADVKAADQISPHSCRHTAITVAFDNKNHLDDVQSFAGHANPRTTRRYDRRKARLDRSPAYSIALAYAKSTTYPANGAPGNR
ncbi:tyrosine-type recombinase/integrase [Streptomyces noursei]